MKSVILQICHTCFNTQPPEGGWLKTQKTAQKNRLFQHTAARRRLVTRFAFCPTFQQVSTYSRPKAAGLRASRSVLLFSSFNTQPPEGGWHSDAFIFQALRWFQHTAARRRLVFTWSARLEVGHVSTHSRPKAAGCVPGVHALIPSFVSTHSRPKAAGRAALPIPSYCLFRFNTQPPEGGWSLSQKPCSIRFRSPDFAKLLRKARTRV